MAKQINPCTWTSLTEEDSVSINDGGKSRTVYICKGVPTDFPFEPVARKEVGEVCFYDLRDLPKNTHNVLPFMKGLKRWMKANGFKVPNMNKKKRQSTPNKVSQQRSSSQPKGQKSIIQSNKQGDDHRYVDEDGFVSFDWEMEESASGANAMGANTGEFSGSTGSSHNNSSSKNTASTLPNVTDQRQAPVSTSSKKMSAKSDADVATLKVLLMGPQGVGDHAVGSKTDTSIPNDNASSETKREPEITLAPKTIVSSRMNDSNYFQFSFDTKKIMKVIKRKLKRR